MSSAIAATRGHAANPSAPRRKQPVLPVGGDPSRREQVLRTLLVGPVFERRVLSRSLHGKEDGLRIAETTQGQENWGMTCTITVQ